MDRYEITVDAEIGQRRCRDLGCERLAPVAPGTSRLRSERVDQAALHGVLRRLRDAGLGLVAIARLPTDTNGGTR